MLSRVQLFLTPWTVAHQAPLSMEFSLQEYWSELPFLSRGDLHPGNEPRSSTSQADVFAFEPPMDEGYMRTVTSCFSIKLLLWHKEHDHYHCINLVRGQVVTRLIIAIIS